MFAIILLSGMASQPRGMNVLLWLELLAVITVYRTFLFWAYIWTQPTSVVLKDFTERVGRTLFYIAIRKEAAHLDFLVVLCGEVKNTRYAQTRNFSGPVT